MTASDGPKAKLPYEQLAPAKRRWLLVKAVLRALASATVLVAVYYVLPLDRTSAMSTVTLLVIGLAVLVATIIWQVGAIIRSDYPKVRAVEALAVTVPLHLLTFASAYLLMARHMAANFTQRLTHTDALYFSVTIFSTVGFGDITARTQAARLVVTAQMIGDLVLIGLGLRAILGAATRSR